MLLFSSIFLRYFFDSLVEIGSIYEMNESSDEYGKGESRYDQTSVSIESVTRDPTNGGGITFLNETTPANIYSVDSARICQPAM